MRVAVFALVLVLSLSFSAGLAACTRGDPDREDEATTEAKMTPLDRLIIGKATAYPADPTLRAALPALRALQAARRSAAWAVAKRALEPVSIGGQTLPRFQTWYARDEVLPMFDRLLRAQAPADLLAHVPPKAEAVAEAFDWEAGPLISFREGAAGRASSRG